MFTHEFTAAPDGYQTKKGCPWVKKEAAVSDSTTRNKVDPTQAPVFLVPMPQEGPKLKRVQMDNIFKEDGFGSEEFRATDPILDIDNPLPSALITSNTTRKQTTLSATLVPDSEGDNSFAELTRQDTIQVDTDKVGRCGDMSSIMHMKMGHMKTGPLVPREQLSPNKKLNLRDMGWCKPFLVDDDSMTEEKLHFELDKAGQKCALKYKDFRSCMRKLDCDHSGEVDLEEFTAFFKNEFAVPHATAEAIFHMLNTQGTGGTDGEKGGHGVEAEAVLDYNELMVVLGPYINPGCPPAIQLKPGNTTTGSVASINLRKLG